MDREVRFRVSRYIPQSSPIYDFQQRAPGSIQIRYMPSQSLDFGSFTYSRSTGIITIALPLGTVVTVDPTGAQLRTTPRAR